MSRYPFIFILIQGLQLVKGICEELPTPLNGKVECENEPLTVGKSCKFTCLEGYYRTGSEKRICLEGKKWSGHPTRCLPRLNSEVRGHQPSHDYYGSHRMNEQSASTDFDNNPCLNYGCKQRCLNVVGKAQCECRNGFILDRSDNKSCIETTLQDSNPMPRNSYGKLSRPPATQREVLSLDKFDIPCKNLDCTQLCVKEKGQVWCGCSRGYILNKEDKRSCDKNLGAPIYPDVHPCLLNNGGCDHVCQRTKNDGFRCKCNPGYTLATDRKKCFQSSGPPIHTDVHPCSIHNGGCDHVCQLETNGRIRCECNPGYTLATDRRRCFQSRTSILQVSCGVSNGGCEHICSVVENAIQCSCRSGYRLHYDGKHCIDIDECVENNGGCDQVCFNTRGSYHCSCRQGYKRDGFSKKCIDIDECQSEFWNSCDHKCINTEGSYSCQCQPGYVLIENRKCQGCRKGAYWSHYDNGCVDCPANSFTQSEGMTSVSDCVCRPGFTGSPKDNILCEDVIEDDYLEDQLYAFLPADSGISASTSTFTRNMRYDTKNPRPIYMIHEDEDGDTSHDNEMATDAAHDFFSQLYNAARRDQLLKKSSTIVVPSRVVVVVQESRTSILQVSCGVSNGGCEHICSVAENAIQCSCRSGYRLHYDGKHCIDIDECQSEFLNSCDHKCINTEGSYSCQCQPGYVLIENRKCQGCRKGAYWSHYDNGCVDCPADSFTQSEGMTSVSDCFCRPGFTGSPKDNILCEDIDECDENNFGCSHQCVNVPGGAFCSCPFGYTTDNDNKTCIDIDECSVKNGGCEGLCHNNEGSFRCSCLAGYRNSNKDIYACEDVDECLEENGGCQHFCNNYRGGYHCSCEKGFRLDSSTKNCTDISCPGLPAPHFSYVTCKNGNQKFGEMDRYPFGTVCKVTCATGFKASDSTNVECQEDGTWKGKLADCRSQRCPPLKAPQHGDVHPPSCSTDGNTVKQSCTFTCHQGYRLKGHQAVFNCKNDLIWRQNISDIPVCEPEEIRASIECIRDVTVNLQPGKSSHNVTIPIPVTNMESYEITPKNITVGKPMEFPAGKTKVLFSTSSLSSNRTAKCQTTVNVIDKEPPEFITCPSDILIENAKVDGEIVTWEEPKVIDNVGVEFLKSSVEPNSTLKPGSYHVEYIARDRAGNTNSCLFKIDIVRLNCGNLTDPVHGKANCMDWLYGNLCQPECDEGYMRYPSDPSFYSCGDSGIWEPSSDITDCLPYTDALSFTCPDGSELITIDETEEEICLECPPLIPWSPTTRKCEENTS